MSMLPTDAKERKKIVLWSGLFRYFPLTLIEVAKLSYIGNEQHNPGEPLHWAREKSSDQEDTLLRHLMEKGTVDTDGVRHIVKAVWRAMAAAELELEAARKEVSPLNGQPFRNSPCRLCGVTSDGYGRFYDLSLCGPCYNNRDVLDK